MSASFNAVTVTSSATQILAASPRRRGFVIANNGSVIIYIGFDSSVTSNTGIPVLPQEKFLSEGDQSVFKGSIIGITASSTSDVRYWEWTS